MAKPLEGLKVIDLTRVLAGPFSTMLLADMGADVIKIENPKGGDDSRAFGPFKNGLSAYYISLNRSKRGITLNLKEDRDRVQFERAYEVYHKLPEILARLDSSAIHLQYSVHISESALMETLDTMKECDNVLREQHYVNEKYYNKEIDALLTEIADSSTVCQSVAERFLIEKENAAEDYEPPHAELEAAFTRLRTSIGNAKSEITSEINKFMFGGEDM